MATIDGRESPTSELAALVVGPKQSGIVYSAEKQIIEQMASGSANDMAFAVQNPESVECIIIDVIVEITTAGGTGSSVLDIDVGSSATATGDDIIDGLDLNAAIVTDKDVSGGSNGGAAVRWNANGGTDDYVTGKILVQNAASLVGTVIIKYVPLS